MFIMGFVRKLSFSIILYIIDIAVESTSSLISKETKILTLRQMIVSNETIYVGGVGDIVSYHRENMTEKAFANINSNVWLLLYDEKNEAIIQCNQNNINVSHCSKLDINLQMTGIESSDMLVDIRYLPTYSMLYVKEVNTSIVVIGANSAKVLNTSYGIFSLNLTDFTLFQTESDEKGPMNIERNNTRNYTLAFKSSFYHAPHFYFFFQVQANNHTESSRIGKLCLKYANDFNKTDFYHSYEDMNISCTYDGNILTSIENIIDEGEFVFFLFLHNNYSFICQHSWADIAKDYNESRRLQLMCRNEGSVKKNGEYFKEDTELDTSTLCFENGSCNKGDVCKELQGDFCKLKYYHTLVGGKGIENMKSVYNINNTITAMDILQTSNYSDLYFGTIDGELGRIKLPSGGWFPDRNYMCPYENLIFSDNVSNDSLLVNFIRNEIEKRNVHIPVQVSLLHSGNFTTKIVSVANSEIINIKVEKDIVYFITEKKIGKLDINDCSIHTDCESCMNSFDSSCGWDYEVNRCNFNNTNSAVWISSEEGNCIHFSNIPQHVKINTTDNTIILFQTFPPKSVDVDENVTRRIDGREGVGDENVTCRIDGREGNVSINTDGNSSCQIDITNLTTGCYTFDIMYEAVIIGNATIEFYKCQDLKTCKKCRKWYYACESWDPINFVCDKPESNLTIQEENNCPQLDSNFTLQLHANRFENITIYLVEVESNLIGNLNSSNFTCEIGQNGSIVQNIQNVEVQWEMNSTNVSCTCIGVKLNESEISYGIRLKYSNMYFDNEVTLIVYTCDSFLNYDVCKNSYAIQRYECEWRNSKCCFIGSEPCCRNNGEFTITEISPISGPINGGTSINVFANYEGNSTDEIFLSIAEANCTGVIVKDKANSFICKTGKEIPQNDDKIKMSVGNCSSTIVNNTYFTYKDPGVIMNFNPRKGILAGNTIITITGKITTFEGPDRYNISFCDKDNITCISCSILNNLNLHDSKIMCKTGESSEPRNLTKLVVVIDTFTKLQLNGTFEYLLNPTFDISKNETLKAIESGGAEFEINGDGFNNVGQITVERVEEPCKVPSDKQAVCKTPEKLLNQTNVQTVIVNFDGIARAFEINYVADPSFERFSGVMNYDKESLITIKGKNILNGAGIGDYNIQVGLDGKCLISEGGISMTYINCFPPKNVPRTNKSEINSVHVIVEVGRIKVYIGDIQYQNDVQILSIIVGVLAAALVIAVTIGILAVMVLKKKKRKAIKEFKMELMTREEMVRKASREEFADAQMTMRSIKSDLFTSKVPFCDYKTYVLRQLFPNQDISTNPLLHGLKISDAKKDVTETAIDNFKTLLSSKLFLKSLVQTIDRPNMLTIQEKAHFSSVLSISLMGNMTLYFDNKTLTTSGRCTDWNWKCFDNDCRLIECLMVDMIRSANKKQQKVLFRRFESITLRLMANWLQIGLYGQLTSNCGMQLFMLYKAVKTIVEMAPIDALTSNSKNTIAEEKLLKMRIEHQSFTLQIDLNGNSDKRYPVKVLDCDTISQVKQKCCAQIYKNSPSSKIPHNDELSLEWQEGRAGKLTLNDIDNTSERNNGMVCLNTLKHYMVKDNSRMVLMYKQRDSHTVNVNSIAFRDESLASEDITLLMPENVECSELEGQKWHLETNVSNLPEGQSNKDVDFGDIFLNRLFLTKLLLSECIDTTFENLIDPQSSSIPIRYFIGMLDKLGKQFGVEQDVLQSWKNECYATRVWAPLIGKPGILFDVIVPAYVEPCMDILRQVFVESFTQTAHKINKESPSQKLLFHKDIPRYRKLIGPFFIRLEPVTDTEFWSEMDEISDKQKLELRFSRQSALQQLYNLYIKKYKTKIINDLEDMEEATDLQLANKLEDVIKIMDESSASR